MAIQSGRWEYWTHLTNRPPDSRYAELAESIVAGLPADYQDNLIAQAFAVKLYLDEQTKYTMSERHETASDPTGEFLFGPHAQLLVTVCTHLMLPYFCGVHSVSLHALEWGMRHRLSNKKDRLFWSWQMMPTLA